MEEVWEESKDDRKRSLDSRQQGELGKHTQASRVKRGGQPSGSRGFLSLRLKRRKANTPPVHPSPKVCPEEHHSKAPNNLVSSELKNSFPFIKSMTARGKARASKKRAGQSSHSLLSPSNRNESQEKTEESRRNTPRHQVDLADTFENGGYGLVMSMMNDGSSQQPRRQQA